MINTPFNFTGSKYKILDQILPLFDNTKSYFYDVFCGGGSVFANVLPYYDKIIINDIIKDLMYIHYNIIHDKNDFLNQLQKHLLNKDDKEGYNNLRKSYNDNPDCYKLFSLILSCQNNMLRFNKNFEFNQTFGKRGFNKNTQQKIDEYANNILPYKEKLVFKNKQFYELNYKENSMIYFDPPYMETEAGYNSYWSKDLQNKLYELILKLNKKNNVSIALSGVWGEHKNNKRSEMIDKLINDNKFNYYIIEHNYEKVARKKNSKNSKEVLITNY